MADEALNIARLNDAPEYEIPRACNIADMTWEGITRSLQTLPSLLGFANFHLATAKAAASAAEHAYKEAATGAFAALREAGEAIGSAKEMAELDEGVLAKKREYLALDAKTSTWYALVKGLEAKASMLQQISARQREELKKNWDHYNDPGQPPERNG